MIASTDFRNAPDNNDKELHELGERIAELAERINAAEARMMTLIADFDRRGGWREGGFSSCAEWLAWRIGIKIGPARERVRTARALENLPRTADALAGGGISYAKVRALTRVATPESEAELLEFARAGSAAKLERTVRMWRKLSRDAELTAEQARRRSRAFSVFVDGDGMYVVRGRLEPEVGAVLTRAVEAASDALFRREGAASGDGHAGEAGAGGHKGDSGSRSHAGTTNAGSRSRADAADVGCHTRDPGVGGDEGYEGDARPNPRQRRADAVGLLAERALAAGFGGRGRRESGAGADGIRSADADGIRSGDADAMGGHLDEPNAAQTAESSAAPRGEPVATPEAESGNAASASSRVESGTRAERYQVMVHCDAATLAAEGEPGRSDLDGIRVSAETSRRMACDAAVVAMVHARDGAPLSVGRRTRTIPPHIRRALEERDRGCRFPGCGCRFTEAHHVRHWADGGATSLRNTLLLCRRHHRAVHEGRVKVSVNRDGTVLFVTPKGRMLLDAPSRPDAPRRRARRRMAARSNGRGGGSAGQSASRLPPVPSAHPGAPAEMSIADLPPVPSAHPGAPAEMSIADLPPVPSAHPGVPAEMSVADLPPVPSVHPSAPAKEERITLSNGAALYRDSDIPWEIEAAAREAMEESMER